MSAKKSKMASIPTPTVSPEEVKFQHDPLLDQECTMQFMGEKGITTISFLQIPSGGKPQLTRGAFVDILKGRITTLCHLNPWILGSLVRDRTVHEKNVLLRYLPNNPSEDEIDRIRVVSDDPSLCSLSVQTPAKETIRAVASSSAVVEKGTALLKDSNKKVCRITLCPSEDDPQGLALIFSLSHAVADGHTYYTLLQMLFDADGPENSLSCARKHSSVEEIVRRGNGEEEYKFQFRPAIVINLVGKYLLGARAKLHLRYVDGDKVVRAKDRARKTHGRGGAFVSTNDILTSSFGVATKSRLLMMAINWRTRISSLAVSDAGNYESCILYDPESYESPYRIRESLLAGLPIRRTSRRKLPSGCETVSCKMSMITNWAFRHFKCECLVKSGADRVSSVPVEMHLPVLQMEDAPLNLAIVFRARKDRLACFYCLMDTSVSDLEEAGAPLGEEIK